MELVVDSNIVISAMISPTGKTRNLLFHFGVKLFAPEFLLEEFEKHRREILSKSKISVYDFNLALALVSSKINFAPLPEFEKFIPEAERVCPDPNDTEYFALAL